jgi:hypothetical protein
MIVKDIIVDLRNALERYEDAKIYRLLNQGIQLLSHMGGGMWDGLIGYIDISVDSTTNTITLPRDVLTPLQVNFDNNPTFPRDQWYEFHLNGVGGGEALQYSRAWDDKGFYPIYKTLTGVVRITATSYASSDDGKTIVITGTDSDDRELSETLTLNLATPPSTVSSFKDIKRITKEVTNAQVTLNEYGGGQRVGWYYPDETNPQYRRIRVSALESVTMMYRRRTLQVTNLNDYIPISNYLAVIQAVKSVDFRYKNNIEQAILTEKDALLLLEREQDTININSPISPQVLNYSFYSNEGLYSDDY